MPYRTAADIVPTDYAYQDPRGGFFGNVFRAVTGVVGGAIGGFLKGGPIGAIGGAVSGAVGATRENLAADSPMNVTGGSPAGTPATAPLKMLPPPGGTATGTGIVLASPLGTPVSAVGLAAQHVGPGGVALKGYHLNKTWSYRRKTGQLVSPKSVMVRNRRMNWANGRALTRAERRISRFVHHATRFIRWIHPHKRGRAFPKFHKRRSK